jgi:membrane glycosyltransferase
MSVMSVIGSSAISINPVWPNSAPQPPASGAMPPQSPLEMPVQDLRQAPAVNPPPQTCWQTWPARLLACGGAGAIATYGVVEMLNVVRFSNMTALQGVLIGFFAVSLLWIGFAAASGVATILHWAPRRRTTQPLPTTRVALLMPVYNEDPIRTTAALQAMAEALHAAGAAPLFEIVILSDSTHANAWIAESAAVAALRTALRALMPVHYRRRWHNAGRKVGNIEDFVKHWGGRYDYMIVLDADSLMSADTLLELVHRMQADAQLGLLQTVPRLCGQETLFGRMQQFASRVYGGVVARGVAAWSGDDGNYWGHNAIIRVRAFAQTCGLPQLQGRKPFGGHVLSHDFVEAALLRRAGWKVRMAPDLDGSWEDGPPSLVDVAIRDRRWAQGNLQHLKIVAARGLSWVSRLHLAVGIMSYLASPLWLVLILVGFALTLQATLIRPEYFTHAFQLFPTWPVFDAARMISLFFFSMLVLLVPKLIGLCSALCTGTRRGCGGTLAMLGSTLIELVLSALYAPVMMLIHTHHVIHIFTGSDSDWVTQRRQAEVIRWRDAWHFHWRHTAVGLLIAAIAFFLSPTLLAWLSPAIAGLVLAIPLSKASGSVRAGRWLARLGLLRTPEESRPPTLLERRDALVRAGQPVHPDGLRHLAQQRSARLAHSEINLPRPLEVRGHPNPHRLTATRKLADAESLHEVLNWLTAPERIEVAADPALLERLALLPQGERSAD